MTTVREQRAFHDSFLVGIWFKAAVGALQLLAGIAVLAINQQTMAAWVARWTTPELIEEPHSHIAAWANSGVVNPGKKRSVAVAGRRLVMITSPSDGGGHCRPGDSSVRMQRGS